MPETSDDLRGLWVFATPRRREYIEAIERAYGNYAEAERELGLSRGIISREMKRLRAVAVERGYSPEHGLTNALPEGFDVTGVSIYHQRTKDSAGYWIKAKKRKDQDPLSHVKRLAEELREEFSDSVGLFSVVSGVIPLGEPHTIVDFEFGDNHFGMYADKEIVGEHFDTDRNTQLSMTAIKRMVSEAPAARVAHITGIGDNTHANDQKHVTPQSGHPLDVDPRGHAHSLMAAARFYIYGTRLMLEKYQNVVVNILPGNHDPDAAFALSAIVAMAFEGNPRVRCDVTPQLVRVFTYGNIGLAYHHGDKIKLTDFPKLIAQDFREEWGRVQNWFALSGHIHHETWKEEMGVLCRSLSTLSGKDRWHSEKGYRALQKTGYTVYDTRYGMEYHRPLRRSEIEAEE